MKEREPLVKSRDYGRDEASAKVRVILYSRSQIKVPI